MILDFLGKGVCQSRETANPHSRAEVLAFDESKKELITQEMQDHASEQCASIIRALLRLLRPTREDAQNMHGNVLSDGSLDVMGFGHPAFISGVPQNQKSLSLTRFD
jgi:hypothetical protein